MAFDVRLVYYGTPRNSQQVWRVYLSLVDCFGEHASFDESRMRWLSKGY